MNLIYCIGKQSQKSQEVASGVLNDVVKIYFIQIPAFSDKNVIRLGRLISVDIYIFFTFMQKLYLEKANNFEKLAP